MKNRRTPNFNSAKHAEPLSRVPLNEQIKKYLIDAIMNGELRAGDPVITLTLANHLGVSQAPVREAIRDLVQLDFLENEPFKATSVRSYTKKQLQDIYVVRAALESIAARLTAVRLTKEDIKALRATLDKMIQAAQQEDEEQMVRLDNEFHEKIVQLSDNEFLHKIWQSIQFGKWTIITTRISSYDLEGLARRHESLLAALETGDPETAMVAMQHHIEDLGKP